MIYLPAGARPTIPVAPVTVKPVQVPGGAQDICSDSVIDAIVTIDSYTYAFKGKRTSKCLFKLTRNYFRVGLTGYHCAIFFILENNRFRIRTVRIVYV